MNNLICLCLSCGIHANMTSSELCMLSY